MSLTAFVSAPVSFQNKVSTSRIVLPFSSNVLYMKTISISKFRILFRPLPVGWMFDRAFFYVVKNIELFGHS